MTDHQSTQNVSPNTVNFDRSVKDPGMPLEAGSLDHTANIRGLSLHEHLRAVAQVPFTRDLGSKVERHDIASNLSPFQTTPFYKTQYPEVVIQALGELYGEYNRAFEDLIEKNREWDTDYQFCVDANGTPRNFFVQIDMMGLPPKFLEIAKDAPVEEVREALRKNIFEIENSLAMYQLLERIFAPEDGGSLFQAGFRDTLQEIRRHFDKPIALLATTQDKYDAMLASEFGKKPGESISADEVRKLSGFDAFMGPDEFRAHVKENGGDSAYLLFVRSSDPVSKLKKPNTVIEQPLLGDDEMRRVVKANSLTANVDAPEMAPERRINDTKGYLTPMRMAYEAHTLEDVYTPEVLKHLSQQKALKDFDGQALDSKLIAYLESEGVDVGEVLRGEVALRAKPLKGTYGCYGHTNGPVTDKEFRRELKKGIKDRGTYVIQLEMPIPRVEDPKLGTFAYIDRNFMGCGPNSDPRFLGGFRSLSPVDGFESNQGRNHGSNETLWAEVY